MNYKITTLVENCVYGRKLQAEHGLSLYIETPENRLLFDCTGFLHAGLPVEVLYLAF